ncbi:MAG: phytanoyl-CoA dioxygenase family protein [Chloroflexota bacterium]
MNTFDALKQLSATSDTLTEEQRRDLDEKGYFIAYDVFSQEEYEAIGAAIDALQAVEGEMGGQEVHTEAGAPRLSNVLNKSTAFDPCLEIQPLLASASYLLGDEIKVHGFNARDALKGQGQQPLHSDAPTHEANDWHVVNSLILIDPFTEDNGPTRVVPGTHRTGQRPQDLLEDPKSPYPDEIKVVAPAGAVVVLNASLWHGGTLNVSGDRRRVLHLSYTRRDLAQQLVQRDFLTDELYERMSDAHRYLLDIV